MMHITFYNLILSFSWNCELVTDKYAASTAFHAQELGFRTILVDDCSRGINMKDIEATKEKIKENNGCVIHSSEVRKVIGVLLSDLSFFIKLSGRNYYHCLSIFII